MAKQGEANVRNAFEDVKDGDRVGLSSIGILIPKV